MPKIEKNEISPMVMGRGANTDNASFGLQKLLQRKDPKLFLKFKFKMTK